MVHTIHIGNWRLGLFAGVCGCLLTATAQAQNGGPGPDLGGSIGVQRVDTPNIQNGAVTVELNVLGNTGFGGGLTQMAVTGAFADSLFFSDRDGRVLRFNPTTGATQSVLNLSDAGRRQGVFQVNGPNSGKGLRGLAFHPDFNQVGTSGYGKLYTAHEEVFGSATAHRPLPSLTSFGAPFASDGNKQDGVIVEWNYDFNAQNVAAGSGRDVYRVQIPYGDHPLQQIAFNPHALSGDADYGLLYATIGDAGGSVSPGPGVDQNRVGQDLRTPMASIIRIDPIQQSGANSFGIPFDNPFGGAGVAGEIYAKGFRHPQTIGFDPRNGKILVGDIGQNNLEEINVIEKGGNYGWAVREGTYLYTDQRTTGNGQNADTSLFPIPLNSSTNATVQTDGGNVNQTVGPLNSDGFKEPAIQLDHIENAHNGLTAIVGGYVYDGILAEELEGLYLFGFLSNNTVAYADASQLDTDGEPTQPLRLLFTDTLGNPIELNQALGVTDLRTLQRFGQDLNGDIYIFSQLNGTIVRLEGTLIPEPTSAMLLVAAGGLLAMRRSRITLK